MKNQYLIYFLLVAVLLLGCLDNKSNQQNKISSFHNIIPIPHTIQLTNEITSIQNGIIFSKKTKQHEKLGNLINSNYIRFFSKKNTQKSEPLFLSFRENKNLTSEEYLIEIQKDSIILEAADNFGFARGTATLLQLPDENGNLPIGKIKDQPDYNYRALMIDCSRSWYSVATLKQIIDLCFFYKIKYLHLHLTDDALFTFPSFAFQKLASKQSYSVAELAELNEYAFERGCILIPEIDIPGHSSVFIEKYPDIFALKNKAENYYTINMGKEEAYAALETLLKEVAKSFPYSPYIHIGGDEVNLNGFANDPDVKNYLKNNNISTLNDLYHHFIVRISQMVKDLGKQPIIWSDFTNEGTVKIPNDIIVMLWRTGGYKPEDLVKDGFKFINASWKPLYVVNNRKWSPQEIYDWIPTTWKGYQTPNSVKGITMEPHQNLMGGSMSVWEQNEFKAIISLRHRLAAMSERLWNTKETDYKNYSKRSTTTDQKLSRFLYPFEIHEKGLLYPDWEDSNFSEHSWFGDSLEISTTYLQKNIGIKYYFFTSKNKTRALPQIQHMKTLESNLVIKENSTIMFQAFKKSSNGNEVLLGHPILKRYQLHPVQIKTQGLIKNFLPHSWENHKFSDSLLVTFSSKLEGDIYYTLDNNKPTKESFKYSQPFYIKESSHLRAQLFSNGKFKLTQPIGSPFHQEYVKLGLEKSLTTEKPITTSNGKYELGITTAINDGEIARWDHWGDHTDGENWIIIDLEKEEEINKFKTYTFWDGYRYYEYSIEISNDKKNWQMVVDRSKNRELSTPDGITDNIEPTKARYLKLNLIRNSANPGLHLVEFNAF